MNCIFLHTWNVSVLCVLSEIRAMCHPLLGQVPCAGTSGRGPGNGNRQLWRSTGIWPPAIATARATRLNVGLALLNRSIDLWQMRSCWLGTKAPRQQQQQQQQPRQQYPIPSLESGWRYESCCFRWCIVLELLPCSPLPATRSPFYLLGCAHPFWLAIWLHATLRSSAHCKFSCEVTFMPCSTHSTPYDLTWQRESRTDRRTDRRWDRPFVTYILVGMRMSFVGTKTALFILLLICVLFADSLFGLSIAFGPFQWVLPAFSH